MARTRTIVSWAAAAALWAGGSALVLPIFLSEGRADTARVVSIKETRDYQDPALLKKAWALPVASAYQADMEFQHNGSVCGPTSLADVLHSLKQPGNQESVLQDTGFSTVMGYLPQGLTLDQLAVIARQKLHRKITVLRDLDLAAFREQLSHVNDPSRRYVINFTRGPLFGTGGGHHSPIAAYLDQEDLVLVLDVNKNYGPWLVKSDRLYEAMNTVDATAQKKRGLLLIE
ncbi:MAG TPA: phytochelatin synthase family protein [Steroidobacteraceae bacterium]|jgi:Phytochelatin synthase|nr:phytochelatin synthase family protein [Steroidobacteraceae bacterium]